MKIKQTAQAFSAEGWMTLAELRMFMESVEDFPNDAAVWVGNGDGDSDDQPQHRLDLIVVSTESTD